MPKLGSQSPSGGCVGGGSKAGTMFVQADSTCFRDLVQRLTGPLGNEAPTPIKFPAPKPAQKLHERRKYTKPKLEIEKPDGFPYQPFSQPKIPLSPPLMCSGSPGGIYRLSPSSYPASPSSVILSSPIGTPMPVVCSNKRGSPSLLELNPGEEEKAIKEKRFYLHPSPRSKQKIASEPELLTLFPLASPTSATAALTIINRKKVLINTSRI